MIKLFWNTQNQILPKTKSEDDENLINYNWGIYHKNNSDEWIYYILNKIKFKTIQKETDLNNGDSLIIIDSSIEKKTELYTKLRLICSKIFLIHLGDESGKYDLSSIYNNCNFIWRAFCSNRYFDKEKINCLPIGYKSGVVLRNSNKGKKYRWAFLGSAHKSSRHDLLFQLSNIKPSFCHKTQQFNVKIINVEEMSNILSATTFMPCPNGFVHPETYRLYEALECECIPIVEDTYKYYDRLFPGNPFIKINRWVEAKDIIKLWDEKRAKEKKEECKIWWNGYKTNLQNSISKIINS